MDQSFIDILKKASENPEYQAIVNYLMSRRQMPEMTYGGNPKDFGQFQYPSLFSDVGSRGRLYMNPNAAGANPADTAPVLQHEMTHGAFQQLYNQVREIKNQKSKSELEKQFLDNFDKVFTKAPQQIQALNPEWAKKNNSYRSRTDEAMAFGVANASNPQKADWTAPSHIDPTLATQFMLLLDQAQRIQDQRPQSQGR